jgi:hypothetical protein
MVPFSLHCSIYSKYSQNQNDTPTRIVYTFSSTRHLFVQQSSWLPANHSKLVLQFQRYQNVEVATKQNHNYSQWSMYPCPQDKISKVTGYPHFIFYYHLSVMLVVTVWSYAAYEKNFGWMNLLPGRVLVKAPHWS